MSGDHHDSHHAEHSHASLRVRALESLLVEKQLMTSDQVDKITNRFVSDIGPRNGARIVARAWTDPEYKKRLLADGTAAIAELGFGGNLLSAVENTETVHNLIVCTLCSCYPWSILGLPPVWYKSFAYRSRAVIEPRAVLPERPDGTEGMSEEQLAELVTRDSMIGVARALAPAAAS